MVQNCGLLNSITRIIPNDRYSEAVSNLKTSILITSKRIKRINDNGNQKRGS